MLADIIILLIMILCTFLGYKRGLIKVAVRVIGFFIAIIIALILYQPISNYIINNTNVVTNLTQTIEDKMYKKEEKENTDNYLINSIDNYTNEVKEEGAKYIAENVAITIIRARYMDFTIHDN